MLEAQHFKLIFQCRKLQISCDCPYPPVICYVQGSITHPQVWPRELLQDDELPSDLSHGRDEPAVPQQVPVSVAVDEVHHGSIDVVGLAELLPQTHQHCLGGKLLQEFGYALQHMAEVRPLVGDPVMNGEVPLDVTHTDVQETDTGLELGGQAPRLAFSIHTAVQSHGVVGPRHGDLRQRLIVRDRGHPGRVQELRGGCVVIVRSLDGTVAQTKDSVVEETVVGNIFSTYQSAHKFI